MSTYVPRQQDITRQWHVIDADAQVLGRIATVAARLGEALPSERERIQAALSGFAMLGDSPSLPLTIEKSVARIAFINLGRVPALK